MKIINLDIAPRESRGSRNAKRLRRSGKVPAVVYGHGMAPLSVEVVRRSLEATLHTKSGTNVIFNLQLSAGKLKESTCLIKEVQHHPVSDQIEHVDFTVISMTEKIRVKVPLEVKNVEESPGVKEGGVFDVIHHEIEVECLPTQIPESILVDAKPLKINDLIHAKDLVLPQGVTCLFAPGEVVAGVHATRVEKEETTEEAAAAAEPEVIEKGKKPAEGAEGAAESAKK